MVGMASPGVSLPDKMVDEVDKIAHERSEPGSPVSRSEVIREAIGEYLNEHGHDKGEREGGEESPAEAQVND